MQCCVVLNDTHTFVSCSYSSNCCIRSFSFTFLFVFLLKFMFLFVFNVAYFEFIALFVFCWVLFSSTSQVFGWKKRLQNYQLRIEWNVKP